MNDNQEQCSKCLDIFPINQLEVQMDGLTEEDFVICKSCAHLSNFEPSLEG